MLRTAGAYRSKTRKAALYGLTPLVGAFSPLLAIPAITTTHAATGWAAIAVGQSVGGAAAVLGELGWGLTGPQTVSQAESKDLGWLYTVSSSSKVAAAALLAPVVFVVALLLAPAYPLVTGLSAIASMLLCLTASWFMVGLGRPGASAMIDVVPRVLGVVIGSVLLFVGCPLYTMPLAMMLSAAVMPWLGSRLVPGGRVLSVKALVSPRAKTMLRHQVVAVSARGASAVYIALPTALVSIVLAAPDVARFAAMDRVVRLALAGLMFLPLSMQAWVGRTPADFLRKRIVFSLSVSGFVGLFAGGAIFVLMPVCEQFLFNGEVDVSGATAVFGGCVILITCLSRATGSLGLVRVGKVRVILASAIMGAAMVPGIVPIAVQFGVTGAMAWLSATELLVLTIQCVALVWVLRDSKYSATEVMVR